MSSDQNEQQTKRRLRREIGRLRRQIDARIHGVERQGRQLASWGSYVQRHPGLAVLAALGLGVAAAFRVKRSDGGTSRAVRQVRRLIRWGVARLWREAKRFWARAKHAVPAGEGGEA